MNPTTPYPPTPDGRAFINGQRCWAQAGARFDNISPVHGQVLCEVARADAADIDLAVQAARRAFADKRWSGLAPAVRKRVLIKWADLIFANSRWAVLQIGLFSKFARRESADFITLTFREASAGHPRGRFLDRSKIPEAADEGESERDHCGEG